MVRGFGSAASTAIVAALLATAVHAQEESAAERQYREDYERVQKVMAVTEPTRRADQLLAFMKDRPESKLTEYAQTNYLLVLEGLAKAENYKTLLPLAEKIVRLRPRAPEAYYFYGAGLHGLNRDAEAMDALARCSVVRNSLSRKARERLEFLYRSQHRGSVAGLEDVIHKAQAAMNP